VDHLNQKVYQETEGKGLRLPVADQQQLREEQGEQKRVVVTELMLEVDQGQRD
jgi:hypothetical protein